MSPSEHANISPSSLNYRKQCRQWAKSELSDSRYAEEGRLLHAAMETDTPDALDGEQLRIYDTLLSFLAPLQYGAVQVFREIRLEIQLNGHTTFGTCDRLIIRPGGLGHLIDFKFGRLSVPEANQNLQALAYAVGAFDLFPELHRIQAWLLVPRRDEASHVVLDRVDLPGYRAQLSQLFDELVVDAPATPSPACDYCGKLATCPAVAQRALVIASAYDPALAALSGVEFHASRMTTQQIDEWALPMSRTLEKWVSAVKAEALARILAGEEFAGHALAERARPQTVDDANAAYTAVADLMTLDEFHATVTVSAAKLRAVVRNNAGRGQKDAAEQEISRRLVAAGLVSAEVETTKFVKRK